MSPEHESAETILEQTALRLVRMHARKVEEIDEKAADQDDATRIKLIDSLAKTGCSLGAFVAQGRKLAAQMKALDEAVATPTKVAVAKAAPAKASNEEMEMDDDSGRTPERMAELHADLRRRLDAARADRESKQVAGRSDPPAHRALPVGVEAKGVSPTTSS